jgi:hypothetical protein
MKFPALFLAFAPAALLAAAPVVAPPAPTPPGEQEPAAPAAKPSPYAPASDYTGQETDTPMVPEYDPATAPPPLYAEPSDDDGMRKCIGPDGIPIFTDRRCGDLGAAPFALSPTLPGGALLPSQALRVHTCARTLGALLEGVRAALETPVPKRLADFYHWSGMGTAEGYRLMDRLDAFSARPVVDVQLVRNALPADEMPDLYEDRFDPLPPPPGLDDPSAIDPAAAPPPRRRRPLASMLRVDQMRSDKDVSSTVTYFHLMTNAGCWWMHF